MGASGNRQGAGFFNEGEPVLRELPADAGPSGYRMPAEWEPQSAVWVLPPHNPETWPGCLDRARSQFAAFLAELRKVVTVRRPAELNIATADSWIRDFGPVFVTRQNADQTSPGAPRGSDGCPALAAHDFRFDAWGGKYADRAGDDAVGRRMMAALGLPGWVHDWVMEGGAIEVDGEGTLMTTAPWLDRAGREAGVDRDRVLERLHAALGTHRSVVLPAGIAGDDTDGHIDEVARFLGPRAVAVVTAEEGHPDHAAGEANLAVVSEAVTSRGGRFDVVPLPSPPAMHFDFPPDGFQPGGAAMLPCSYANFFISNGTLFVPVFGVQTDERAIAALSRAMPPYRVQPVRAEWLAVGLGTLHCLTMQQPAV